MMKRMHCYWQCVEKGKRLPQKDHTYAYDVTFWIQTDLESSVLNEPESVIHGFHLSQPVLRAFSDRSTNCSHRHSFDLAETRLMVFSCVQKSILASPDAQGQRFLRCSLGHLARSHRRAICGGSLSKSTRKKWGKKPTIGMTMNNGRWTMDPSLFRVFWFPKFWIMFFYDVILFCFFTWCPPKIKSFGLK